MGMGSKSPPGSSAFLKVSGRPFVDPMALSLSVGVGDLKFIAKLTEQVKKIVMQKRVRLMVLI